MGHVPVSPIAPGDVLLKSFGLKHDFNVRLGLIQSAPSFPAEFEWWSNRKTLW